MQPEVLRPGWALPCTLGCSPVGFSSGTRPPEILFRYRFIPGEKSTLHFSACPSLGEEPWTWATGQRDVGREATLLGGACTMGSSWWRPQMRGSPFVHSEVAFLVPRCGADPHRLLFQKPVGASALWHLSLSWAVFTDSPRGDPPGSAHGGAEGEPGDAGEGAGDLRAPLPTC